MAIRNSIFAPKSRYVQGGDTEEYDKRLGWWERDLDTLLKSDTDNIIFISSEFDRRPDLFAAEYFGRSDLMWIVLQFNSIVDINEEFIAGKEIKLPVPDRVAFDFLNKNTGGIPPKTQNI